MSAGIATHSVRIFPKVSDLRKIHFNLTPGSMIAHFNAEVRTESLLQEQNDIFSSNRFILFYINVFVA